MCAICVTNTCNVRTECMYVSVRASVYVCMFECFYFYFLSFWPLGDLSCEDMCVLCILCQ